MASVRRQSRRLWLRWVAANAVAELVGLGTVAVVGYLLFGRFADPQTWQVKLLASGAFVALGAFEGLVVGLAQARVLRTALPSVQGWVGATVCGAVAAWAIGMVPSTVASFVSEPGGAPPQEPALWLVLILAAGLGAVAGPILAAFQWRSLRRALPAGAWLWLPANGAAWCLGMPVIFLGAQANELTTSFVAIAFVVSIALLAAGAIVGAVHGRVLVMLTRRAVAQQAA